jgi:shikimate kinase
MRIFIIGFMGCGKSKKGRKVANYLGLNFIDMDDWVEKKEGSSIEEIFASKGEDYFRKAEYEALHQITQLDSILVATGGGSPCHFDALDKMNALGTTVYLKATPLFLKDRLLQSKKKRPLVANLNEAELLAYIETKLNERKVFYEKATLQVDAVGCRSKDLADLIRTYSRSG